MSIRLQTIFVLGLLTVCSRPTAVGQQPQSEVSSGASFGSGSVRVEDGTVDFIHNVQIAAQADGLVEQLLVDEGHAVKKGDILLMIDSRVAKAEVAVARSELEAAEKQAEQEAEVKYAEAAAELSKKEFNSELELYAGNATTYSALERKQLEAMRAKFGVDVAKVNHAKEGLAVDVAKEKLKAAEVRLEIYKVVAPYDGVIVERLRDQGEWVRSGEPILRLVNLNDIKIQAYVDVDGISIGALVGAPIEIEIRINPKQVVTYKARVDFVSPELSSERIRIFSRIENENPGGVWLLRDGMKASIEITLPR